MTLDEIIDQLEFLICNTPTGELRNELTNANIHVHLARKIYKNENFVDRYKSMSQRLHNHES